MKTRIISMAILVVACSGICAADAITLVNPGFEDGPGTAKLKYGFDMTNNDVPGWANGGTAYNDEGIEPSNAHTGLISAYFNSGSDSAIQLTDYTILLNDLFSLTFWSKSGQGSNAKMVATIYYDDGGSRVTIATQDFILTTDYAQYTLNSAAVTGAAVGKKVGIEFENEIAAGSGMVYASLDDVALSVTPEPTTLILLGAGLLGLRAKHRRRK